MSNWYYYNGTFVPENELYHYGVKGMRWGHRKKYYNSDGSLNKLGQARQNYKTANRAYGRAYNKAYNYSAMRPIGQHLGTGKVKSDKLWDDAYDKLHDADKAKKSYKDAKKEYKEQKKAERNTPEAKAARKKAMIKAGATAAAVALAAYGAYKVSERIKTNDAVRRTLLERSDRAGIGKNVIYENTGSILSKNYNKGLQERLQRSGVNTNVITSKRRSTGEIASEAAKKVASSVKDKASNAAKKAKVEFDYVTAKADNLAWKTGNTAKTVGNKAKSAATNAANKVKDYVSDYEMPSIRSNKVPPHLRNTTLDPRGNYWKKRRR